MNTYGRMAPTLEALYTLATWVCEEADLFQPDLLLGLAHSGWLPVVVARSLRKASGRSPLPPAVRTNIGREKHEIYKQRYGDQFPAFCCGQCSDEPFRVGHYLAWVAQQQQWRSELQEQVRAVLGETSPQRVLVVDDIYGGLRSGYTTLGLLNAVYPGAKCQMVAGYADLVDVFVDGWAEKFAPGLAQELAAAGPPETGPHHELAGKFKSLVTGTEDIDPASLLWREIDAGSPAVQAALAYAPLENALECNAWVQRVACQYAHARWKGLIKKEYVVDHPDDRVFPIQTLYLQAEELVERDAWLQSGLAFSSRAYMGH